MRSGIQESTDLCLRVMDMLEQDSYELSRSLDGEILDAYRDVVQAELERMQRVRMQLLREMTSI